MAIITVILISIACCLVKSINTTIDYFSKLHGDLFSTYKKKLGPFSRASVKDGGDQVVTVTFNSQLLAVEHLVSWVIFFPFLPKLLFKT